MATPSGNWLLATHNLSTERTKEAIGKIKAEENRWSLEEDLRLVKCFKLQGTFGNDEIGIGLEWFTKVMSLLPSA